MDEEETRSTEPPSASASPILNYASGIADPCVARSKSPAGLRIEIFDRDRRARAASAFAGEALASIISGLATIPVLLYFFRDVKFVMAAIAAFFVAGLVLFQLHWLISSRLDRPMTIVLSADELTFSGFGEDGRVKTVIPRSRIYDVYYTAHANSITVRAQGRDMFIVGLAAGRPDAEQIVAWIREELRLEMQRTVA